MSRAAAAHSVGRVPQQVTLWRRGQLALHSEGEALRGGGAVGDHSRVEVDDRLQRPYARTIAVRARTLPYYRFQKSLMTLVDERGREVR